MGFVLVFVFPKRVRDETNMAENERGPAQEETIVTRTLLPSKTVPSPGLLQDKASEAPVGEWGTRHETS